MTDTPAGGPPSASRYGRAPMPTRTRRWIVQALAGLTVLAGVAFAVVAYQRFERNDVEGKLTGYEVLDDHTVAVTISVSRKDPATPVVCIVRARSRDGAETGRREVVVGPADARTIQVTADVVSSGRPYVGDIYGCGTDIPEYLTAPG